MLTEFDSTAVRRALYDPERETLDLWYADEDRYTYFAVPPDVHDELLRVHEAGESVGAFVNDRIKPFYDFEPHPRPRRFRPG